MSNEITVLVVDDDPVIRTVLEKFLAPSYNVICAEHGIQALDIIKRDNNIDVILTDLEMPQLDGLGLLTQVHSVHPEICVILISGSADTSTAVGAIRKGAYDYISKPFGDMDEVRIIIERWLQQQSLEAKLSQYATLHREMMRNMKTRTFLAVDVVGSTRIKQGEDPFIVQFSFKAYQKYVEAIVKKHDGIIHSTSGDGAMACFQGSTCAVETAREILSELETFNLKSSQLEADFKLRIGIHTGQVIISKDGNIDEMFSESLDIAGHIQKDADPNSAIISESTLEVISNPNDFMSTDRKIDGICLYRLVA